MSPIRYFKCTLWFGMGLGVSSGELSSCNSQSWPRLAFPSLIWWEWLRGGGLFITPCHAKWELQGDRVIGQVRFIGRRVTCHLGSDKVGGAGCMPDGKLQGSWIMLQGWLKFHSGWVLCQVEVQIGWDYIPTWKVWSVWSGARWSSHKGGNFVLPGRHLSG